MRVSHKMKRPTSKYGDSERRRARTSGRRCESAELRERIEILVNRVPVLAEVREEIGSVLFRRLAKALLSELDDTLEKGRDNAPSYSSSSNSGGRGDTGSRTYDSSFILEAVRREQERRYWENDRR